MEQPNNSQERRNSPRIEVNFVVSYHTKESSEAYDLSQTKNISQGGILITTNKRFEKESRLTMFMRIPFISQKIELEGEVIDSTELVKGLIYETRVKFLNLADDFFIKLGEFIKENLKRKS